MMKILLCIKQVPESECAIQIDEAAQWIKSDGLTAFKMNRWDEFAAEEAVLIKAKFPGTTIDAISVGPPRAVEVIKRALGMGADHGIHIVTAGDGYLSPFSVASWIAEYARRKNYGLILAGAMSEDLMQGQVGPMLAAHLALPCATGVIYAQVDPLSETVYAEREIEGGRRDTLKLLLPALLTIQSGINTPRYPSLSNLLRANRQALETIQAPVPAPSAAKEQVVEVAYPEKLRAGNVLAGTSQAKARRLLSLLREKALMH
ncbi:MAG: electron transfer flavoprotein subunit beta/FixA family protein [Desulfobacterales bacterium]|nr:MAG: electron transfer flavoprotein subunit beta/FixA family protein [Desulfobacterales bacterium]